MRLLGETRSRENQRGALLLNLALDSDPRCPIVQVLKLHKHF